jgi:signal transduction histidine kinase
MEGSLHNLEQIVLNLVINAIQAMEGRPGKVRIHTFCRGGRLYLTIADTGKGIHPSIAERIFDPFVTDRQGQGGTGLGLSVTYNLVKAHGGEIRFKTKEGEGTLFEVSFPHQ